MVGKRAIMMAGVGALLLALTSSFAMAQGFRGGHGDRGMFLLAKSAGLTKTQVITAFKSDSNLSTDRTNLKNAHQALLQCLVSGNACTTQIATFTSAQSALEQERLTIWAGLFKSAPDLSQASSTLTQLQNLQAQRQALMHQIFANSSSSDSSSSGGQAE